MRTLSIALMAATLISVGCRDEGQNAAAAGAAAGDSSAVSGAGAAGEAPTASNGGGAVGSDAGASDAGELNVAGGPSVLDSDAGASAQAGGAGEPLLSASAGVGGVGQNEPGAGGTLNRGGASNEGGEAANPSGGAGGQGGRGGTGGGPTTSCAGAGGVPCATGFSCVRNHCQAAACDGTLGFPALPFRRPGYSQNAAVAADLDGDGRLDIAVADANLVSVLINQGAGRLALALSFELVGLDIVAADFNGDGRSDLAIASGTGLAVLLNQGALQFAAPSLYPVGEGTWSLATADLDGDAHPDLVVATSADDKLSVLKNRGDGTFWPPQRYATGSHPNAVVLNDLNGDGRPDAVTSNYFGNSLSVFFNQGESGFAPAITLATDAMPTFLAAGDVTGDGHSDLVVSHEDDHVTILANQGNGTFVVAGSEAVGMTPYGVTVADVNGDSALDIATANYNGGVTILTNSGGGTFVASLVNAGQNPESVIAADLNQDGRRELIVTNQGGSDLSVLSSDGSRQSYALAPAQYFAGSGANAVAAADFNRDGSLDLAAISAAFNNPKLQILLNRGDATFEPQAGPNLKLAGSAIAAGDLDGDGWPDLAMVDGQTLGVSWFRNRGDATFDAGAMLNTGWIPTHIALGDIDADGRLDIAVATAVQGVSVLMNRGAGMFGMAPLSDPGHVASSIRIADVDDDGHADLLTTDGNSARVWWGDGKGQFAEPDAFGLWTDTSVAEVADFTGDGHSDLVLTGQNSEQVLVLRGLGNRLFARAQQLPSAQSPNSLAALDVNLDGHVDLVSASVAWSDHGAHMDVFLNNGHGQLLPPLPYYRPGSLYSIVTGQFDTDGRPDVVVAGQDGVSIMRNVCLPIPAPELSLPPDPPAMPDFATLKRTCDQRALPFALVDADYSRSLDRVVIAATQPHRLVILDPRTGTSNIVPLTLSPTAVSVAPAGHTAVVLQNGALSWVDLDSASLIKTLPGYAGGEVVLADSQFAYLFSEAEREVASIDLVHETSTLTRADSYSGITLNAPKNAIYACSPYFGPVNIEEYAIGGGHAQYQGTSDTPWQQYPPLFTSLDGNRTFNATGTVMYAAPGRARDMKVETALQGPFYGFGYRYIAGDLINRRTYAIQGGNTYAGGLLSTFVEPEQWIAVYADADLSYQGVIPVPCRHTDNHDWDSYGRFVFASQSGDRLYVITTTSAEAALTERWALGVFDALGHPVPVSGP